MCVMWFRLACALACAAVGALASPPVIPMASLSRVNDLENGAARRAAAADLGLPQVWAQLNISSATAARLLSSPEVRVASNGLFYYTCAGSGAPHSHDASAAAVGLPAATPGRFAQPGAAGTAAAAATADDPFSLPFPTPDQAFKLHSNPGAKSALYLDFTGCDLRTSWWRDTTNNRAFALTRANANATRSEDSFTDQERQLIVASWRQTAEVYRAWDVDVTTEDTTNNTAITTQVVCIGGSVEDWAIPTKQASGSTIGLCWVGTFGNPRGPCLVWSESVGYLRHALRDTIAHEVGHALGLEHSPSGIMTAISDNTDRILRFTNESEKDQVASITRKLPTVSARVGSNTTNATLLCSAPSLFGFTTSCATGPDSITTAVVETVMASSVPHVYRFDAPAAARVREILVDVTPGYLWPGGHPGGITSSSMDTLLEILGPDQLVPLSPTPATNNPDENIIGGQGAALRDVLLPRAGVYFIRVSSAKYGALGAYKLTATLPVADTPTSVPPLANPDAATVEATRIVVVPVLANDVDRSGITGPLVLESVARPSQGVAVVTAQQAISYAAPADFQGQVEVTYTVQDRWGLTATGTLTLTVVPFNIQPPVARDDFTTGSACAFGSFFMFAGQQRFVDVLANDYDPDNTTLAIKEVSTVTDSFGRDTLGAKAEISDDGTKIVFTSNAPIPGTESSRSLLFTYTIVNAAELTATATVCISTSWPSDTSAYMPLARSDNFTVIALQENTLQVLTNDDTTLGSGPLRVVNVTDDTVLRVAPTISDGGDAIVYTPIFSSGDVQPWPAKDVFEYTVINAWGYTATASINVTVIEYGELPPLVDDLTDPVSLNTDESTTYDARKLIKSRSNATVRVIRWGPAEPPVGTPFIDVLENYLLMFKADTNYTGWVRVPYTVLDSNGFQATGFINIPLNNPGPLPGPPPPPMKSAPPPPPSTEGTLAAKDDIASCQLRRTVDIAVLANDGGSRATRVVAVTKPTVGQAAVAPGGRSVRYLAPRYLPSVFKRVVRFSYTVKDDVSGTIGTAYVTVVLTQPGQAPCRRLTLPCVSPSGVLSLSCAAGGHCVEHRGYACRYTYRPAGTTCRAAYRPCDVAETCTGTSATCPPDAKAPDGTGCSGRRPYGLYTISYRRSSSAAAATASVTTSDDAAVDTAAAGTAPDLAAAVSASDSQDVSVQGRRGSSAPRCGVCRAGRCQAVPASAGSFTCAASG